MTKGPKPSLYSPLAVFMGDLSIGKDHAACAQLTPHTPVQDGLVNAASVEDAATPPPARTGRAGPPQVTGPFENTPDETKSASHTPLDAGCVTLFWPS